MSAHRFSTTNQPPSPKGRKLAKRHIPDANKDVKVIEQEDGSFLFDPLSRKGKEWFSTKIVGSRTSWGSLIVPKFKFMEMLSMLNEFSITYRAP